MTDQLGYGKHDPVFSMATKYQQCLEENEQLKAKIEALKKVYEKYKHRLHGGGIEEASHQTRGEIATELLQALKAVCEDKK